MSETSINNDESFFEINPKNGVFLAAPPNEIILDSAEPAIISETIHPETRPIETPEEVQQKQYDHRITELINQAKIHASEKAKIKKIRQKLFSPNKTIFSSLPPPLKANESTGLKKNLLEFKRILSLRLAGSKKPKELLNLVQYIESNLYDEKTEFINVKPSEYKETKEKYEKEGWTVESLDENSEYFKKQDLVRIQIKKNDHIKINSQKAIKLEPFLNLPNDFDTIIPKLNQIGMHINDHTLKYNLDSLHEIMSNSYINPLLDKLKQIEIPKYFYTGIAFDETNSPHDLCEFAQLDYEQNILTPEIISRLNKISNNSYFSIHSIQELKDYIYLVNDTDAYNLYTRLDENIPYTSKGLKILQLFQAIAKTNLIPQINTLLDMNIDRKYIIPDAIFHRFDIEGITDQDVELITSEIKAQIDDPRLHEIMSDKELTDFIITATTLQKFKISPETAGNYQYLENKPEFLAVLEMLSHWDKSITNNPILFTRNEFEALRDTELIKTIIDPGFDSFMIYLQDHFNFNFSLSQLIESDQIISLYKDKKIRDLITAPDSLPLLQFYNNLETHEVRNCIQLLEIPNALPLLEKFKTNFNYVFKPLFQDDQSIKIISELCKNREKQDILFSNDTVDLYNKLSETYSYNFSLERIDELISLRENPEDQAKLFDQKNIEFLHAILRIEKKLFKYNDKNLEFMSETLDLDSSLKSFIYQLNQNYLYTFDISDLPIINEMYNDQELQAKIIDPERNKLATRIKEIGRKYDNFNLSEIRNIAELPLDFDSFISEITSITKYRFYIEDLPQLAKFSKNRTEILNILSLFENESITYKFDIENIDKLVQLNDYPSESIRALIIAISKINKDQIFRNEDIDICKYFMESNVDVSQIPDLIKIYNQFDTTTEPFSASLLINTLKFKANAESLLQVSQKINELGCKHDPIRSVESLQQIIDFDLLPLFELTKNTGGRQPYFNQLDDFIAFRQDSKYEDMINVYHILNRFIPQPQFFDINKKTLYRPLTEVENLEDVLKNLPPETLRTFTNTRTIRIVVELNGDLEKVKLISKVINDFYFDDNIDATKNLTNFLEKFDQGMFSANELYSIMSMSENSRKTRKLMNKMASLRTLEWLLPEEKRSNFNITKIDQEFLSCMKEVNHNLAKVACLFVFADESPENANQIRQQIESRLAAEPSDELFEDNFRIIIDSVAIFCEKYPPDNEFMKEPFQKEMKAIRQALKLILIPDPALYTKERILKSQPQFDRLSAELPDIDKKDLIQSWNDMTPPIKDIIDPRLTSEKEGLYNKLSLIKTVFNDEILPDLAQLFTKKIQALQQTVETINYNQSTDPIKLELFKKYFLGEKGTSKNDIKNIYRLISHDINDKKSTLSAGKIQPNLKKEVGQQLSILNKMHEIIACVIRLSDIDPKRLDLNYKYTQSINRTAELLAVNLQSLNIIGKQKENNQEPEEALETDMRDRLVEIINIIKKEDHPKVIKVQSEFTTNFNDLARCPEFTSSCQRLTENTSYNQGAYSRLIDGINELIDLHEIQTEKNSKGILQNQKRQRLARCFTEISAFKEESNSKPRTIVLMDRPYIHPDHSDLGLELIQIMIKTAMTRFQSNPELSILISHQFNYYIQKLEPLINSYGYQIKKIDSGKYFINESNLKLNQGKYYDSMNGLTDTRNSHYNAISDCYLLESNSNPHPIFEQQL